MPAGHCQACLPAQPDGSRLSSHPVCRSAHSIHPPKPPNTPNTSTRDFNATRSSSRTVVMELCTGHVGSLAMTSRSGIIIISRSDSRARNIVGDNCVINDSCGGYIIGARKAESFRRDIYSTAKS
ncbi:hypothetical protein C0Q70_00332 [Pomacea canaliculata]|uniref:Uncharacterized protein n=1 Tax=Pomacea canaliculata TaxID=400727 RepID=A0A2T7PWC8_POMCA|nr:hypothetical protein C0Q70_00332 [Pomacea canaliculata]